MTQDVHFSSKSVEWRTPRYIFDFFNSCYNFDLDPCATQENALCAEFYTTVEDGLAQLWTNRKVFMNPPYGAKIIDKWVKKAYYECLLNDALVVCLLPARTDTKWFWDYCTKGAVYFLQGRIKFNKMAGESWSAPFPSMIVIFEKGCLSHKIICNSNDDVLGVFSINHRNIMAEYKTAKEQPNESI